MSPGQLDVNLLVSVATSLGRGLYHAWLNCTRLDLISPPADVGVVLLQLSETRFCRVYPDQLHKSDDGFRGRDGAEMRQLSVKHTHTWPQPVFECLIGAPNQPYYGRVNNQALAFDTDIRPVSWYPQESITDLSDNAFVQFARYRNQDAPSWRTEPMMDVAGVRAIPEAVVTFAIRIKNPRLSWPGTPLDSVSDLLASASISATSDNNNSRGPSSRDAEKAIVTAHSFDVVFGYNCLSNADGAVTRRLSPWTALTKHRPRPLLHAEPTYQDQLAEWRKNLEATVQEDQATSYDIPISDYHFLKDYDRRSAGIVITRLGVRLQDRMLWNMVVHVIELHHLDSTMIPKNDKDSNGADTW